MDVTEKMRRWKRSLDGYVSFRKAVLLALAAFVLLLYVGPTFLSWLLGLDSAASRRYDANYASCVNDKMLGCVSTYGASNSQLVKRGCHIH